MGTVPRGSFSLVAYDGMGAVIARNYALFNYVPNGFVLRIK